MVREPWFKKPERYAAIIEAIRLPESDYLDIAACLQRVFPVAWVEREVRRIRDLAGDTGISRAYLTLRPHQPDFLGHNPLPEMLAGKVSGGPVLCELIRLGKDLRDISHLDRVSELIESLKKFRLYHGALFEVEVLAEFARAGLCPAKFPSHTGGPDFNFQVGSRSFFGEITRMHMSDVGRPGLRLMRHINESELDGTFAFGGWFHVRVESGELDIPAVLRTLERLEGKAGEKEVTYQARGFSVRARRGAVEGGYSVTWWEEVRSRVARTLRRKARRSCKGPRNMLVLDLRSAIHPYCSWMPPERQRNVRESFGEALEACTGFLKRHPEVLGVLLWLPRALSRSDPYTAAFAPDYRVLVEARWGEKKHKVSSALSFCVLPGDLPPPVQAGNGPRP